VAFEARGPLRQVSQCNCSICSRKGFLHWIIPRERFRLLTPESELSTYRFNTGVAQHHFCRTCGLYTFHRKRVTPDYYGVNVFCLEDFDPAGIPVRATVGAGMP
jgi:hypothetical protein